MSPALFCAQCVSVNRPKASQADREEHQTPTEGGEDENRYRGGGEKAETSEALPLLRPTVTLSRIGSQELSALSRICTTLIPPSPRLPVVHRRMTDAERRAQKQPKSANVTQRRGFGEVGRLLALGFPISDLP